jgi:hypothetical protein
MAEDGPLLNFFPDPPPFFKHFTTENLARLKEAESAASNGDDTAHDGLSTTPKLSPEQILALPTELRYLLPPPPPSDDESFHIFGEPAKSSGTNNFTQTMDFINLSSAIGATPSSTRPPPLPLSRQAPPRTRPTPTSTASSTSTVLIAPYYWSTCRCLVF